MKNTARILVVDDQAGMRMTLKGILTKRGYDVTLAEDGEKALAAVKAGSFRLVLMDIKMPGMSGVETYVRMKQVDPELSVIMMTAFAVQDEIRRAIREGAYTVIYKPFQIDVMLGLIDECLADRRLILLVDDHPDVRNGLKVMLETRGFAVVDSDSGEDCLQKIEQRNYQIILLDVSLPGIDGIETLRRLKKVRPDVGVIMMSGMSSQTVVDESLKNGSLAYVNKPIDMQRLLDLIDKNIKGGGNKPA